MTERIKRIINGALEKAIEESRQQSGPSSIYLPGIGTIRHQSSKKGRHAKNWYLRKNYMGIRKAISLKTSDLEEAKKRAVLESNRIVARYGRGEPIDDGKRKRLKFEDLAEMIRISYDLKGNKSKDKLEDSINHLSSYLAGVRAMHITAGKIEDYIFHREKKEGAARGTVYGEIQNLKRMFRIANKKEGLNHHPDFPEGFKPDNARQGFFEEEQFWAVAKRLDEDVRPIALFAYYTGWRKNEILKLDWANNVDMKRGKVRLLPGTTKNGKGRIFSYGELPALKALIEHQRKRADEIERNTGMPVTHVFFRSNGRPVKSFKAAWAKATEAAGVGDRIFHDLRRTAVRNLIDAGVPEHTAQTITGHLTRDVFDRYDIRNDEDRKKAIGKLADYLGQPESNQPEPPKEEEEKLKTAEEEPVEEEPMVAVGGAGRILTFPSRKAGKDSGKSSTFSRK